MVNRAHIQSEPHNKTVDHVNYFDKSSNPGSGEGPGTGYKEGHSGGPFHKNLWKVLYENDESLHGDCYSDGESI